MKKTVILAAVLLGVVLSASAQKRGTKSKAKAKPKTEQVKPAKTENEEAAPKEGKAGDLNREMEVTRAYEPTVSEANKLNVKPNLLDTVALRPELNYRITPQPVAYGFEVAPIKPASINIDLFQRQKPLYVKAAFGFPAQSLLDVYFNTTGKSSGKVGAYINHYGSWSKIKNGNDFKTPASETFNKIGVLGEKRWGRYTLDGEIGFDYDKVSRYGFYSAGAALPEVFDTTASGLRQNFSTLRARVGFGDSFQDLSHFNFRVGFGVANFSDRFDQAETGFNANLDLGKSFGGKHEVTLHTAYEGYFGAQGRSGEGNHLVTVAPLYHLKTGKFDFALGVDFTYNSMTQGHLIGSPSLELSQCYFYPRFLMRIDAANGYFVPYVEIDGGLRSNDYRSLASRNPYVESVFVPNTSEYNGRVGVTGSFSSSFSYKVYGGVSFYRDMATFANLFSSGRYGNTFGNTFAVLSDSVTVWTVGADLEGRISGALGIEASVQYKGFSKKRFDHVSGMPNFTARLDLRYSIRDKVVLTLGGTLLTSRYFALQTGYNLTSPGGLTWEQVGTTVDLHFGAEYRINKAVAVFLQANNLANQKLYPYYLYRGLGINALVGVKLVF